MRSGRKPEKRCQRVKRMNSDLSTQITVMFSALNTKSAANAFPEARTLARLLVSRCAPYAADTIAVKPPDLTVFATAAVEIWLRALHSFLISASLTDASPIWASVAGYYSSHYSVRAFAHLFGLFHLHTAKRIIQIKRQGKGWVFEITRKNGGDREHKLYWKYLAEHKALRNDPFFYPNREDIPQSDGSHRNRANYADHLNAFPIFKPLSEEYLAHRIQKIAEIEFSAVPIPNADKFPDIATVQILAYHRIVKFRKLLDEIVGTDNRFWGVQRNPSWRPKDLTFEVVEPVFTALYTRPT
jgi:hypothetical protein